MKRWLGFPRGAEWIVRLAVACVMAVIAWPLAAVWQTAAAEEPSPAAAPPGNPLAPGCIKLLRDEIEAGLRARNIEDRFNRWQYYMASRLDNSAGVYSGTEVTGNCRLSWYDHLMRHVLDAPAEAEEFTRTLHQNLRGDHLGLYRALATAREKMDIRPPKPRRFRSPATPEEALLMVQQAVVEAQAGYAKALAPLSRNEIAELERNLYPTMTAACVMGHTIEDRPTGRRLCDLLEKADRSGFYDAADALVPLTDAKLLDQLAKLPEEGDVQVDGVQGTVLRRVITSAGTILVGGRGRNVYELDRLTDVCAVIDLGGDDEYYEGSCNFNRPVLVVLDLAGNNTFRGSQPGIQGGAVLGVSMLLDRQGNGTYQARDVAQGSALGGVGMLITGAGSHTYRGLRRVQGAALGGLGLLLARSGKNDKDDFHAAMWGQGFGHPLGFGVLDDLDGNDHYYIGGMWRDSYPETPGYEGWGQGVGAGIRQSADGGIGVLLDGGGDDVYEYDYMAHGGGYWLGLGFARDFAGNDRRLGATLNAYDGGPRTQERFQRFACGFGCHYALGFCFDDSGNDTYDGTIMGLGMGWDCSVGVLCDFAGNDHYLATGGLTQGTGAQASLGILFDYKGDDVYEGYNQGYADPSISYHDRPQCGGNFSFLIDYGGKDTYGCGAANNSVIQRGDVGGFLIDRPSREELAKEEAAKKAQAKPTAAQQDPNHKKKAGAKPNDPVPAP